MLSQRVGAPSFFLLCSMHAAFFFTVEVHHCFLIHSFTDGRLGCFQNLVIVNCSTMNIGVHRFFCVGVSGFLGYNPNSGIAGPKGRSIFNFLRISILISIVVAPICIPTSSALRFLFLLLTLIFCWFAYDGHSHWCKVVSHFVFNLHSHWCKVVSHCVFN